MLVLDVFPYNGKGIHFQGILSYFYAVNIHRIYMARCIEIAKNGLGTTAPNPMVGCVIVHNEKIIGEGFTSPYGSAHAEVNAIRSVKEKKLLAAATLYVTLEPCSHFGKTPPCADLIIEHKIPKIFIGLSDPHEKVSGKGIEKLQKAGCEVITGILEKPCREHHRRFLTFHKQKRPYIILKWAETVDGFIAPRKDLRHENPEPFWITNSYSRQLVHQWRSEEQAILVGTQTVLEDNPRLDVRNWVGKNPVRLVLDKSLRIDQGYHVLDENVRTIVFTEKANASQRKKGIEYALVDFSKNIASEVCEIVYRENITSILVEGGAQTLQTFIDAKLWDEARIFTGNKIFQKGVKAPSISGTWVGRKNCASDILNLYRND